MKTQNARYQLLVIDPCRETQSRIAHHLQGRGVSVMAVSDPTAALLTIESAAPDLVITDLFLPDGAGLSLVKELNSRPDLCPIIAMADGAPEQMIVQALRLGAADYVHKPIMEDELAQALQRAQNRVLGALTDLPGLRGSEYRLSMDSDPAHIPAVVSWLTKATASMLPPVRRLHLQGALQELLFNAIEHGNLEIGYQEKQKALVDGNYEELLTERLAQARLRDRSVAVQVVHDRGASVTVYRITDEGKGFQWRSLLSRAHEACESEAANGRGIFLALAFFPSLTYNDRGNEVVLTVPLT